MSSEPLSREWFEAQIYNFDTPDPKDQMEDRREAVAEALEWAADVCYRGGECEGGEDGAEAAGVGGGYEYASADYCNEFRAKAREVRDG